MLRFSRTAGRAVKACVFVAGVGRGSLRHVEADAARRAAELSFECFVALFDARHW
jgi:hypothetical protein